LLKELIAAIGDRCGEVRPVRDLKGEYRSGVIAPKALQLKDPSSVRSASPMRVRGSAGGPTR